MIIHRVHQAELQEVQYLDQTRRNTGGFGHTGK
jgi:dUTPase